MKRKFRLTRSTDFKRVRRSGKSYAHPLVVLVVAPNDLEQVRIGVVAGHTVGMAVERNRVKRRLRAGLETWVPRLKPGWDLIFLARPALQRATYPQVLEALHTVIRRTGLILPVGEAHDDPA